MSYIVCVNYRRMTNAEKLAKYEAKLVIWEEAEESVALKGQSYMYDDGDLKRQLTQANITEIRHMISFYENKIAKLERIIDGTAKSIVYARGRG